MKFKIGDRVRVTNALGTQKWAEGVEFTIDYFHADDSLGQLGWYEGTQATKGGDPWSAYEENEDQASGGIWEANLELAPTLEQKLEAAKAEVASLKRQIKARNRIDLDALPNGSVVGNQSYYYVKLGDGWYAIATVVTGSDLDFKSGPFAPDDFDKVTVVREGIK